MYDGTDQLPAAYQEISGEKVGSLNLSSDQSTINKPTTINKLCKAQSIRLNVFITLLFKELHEAAYKPI
ncbi:hypothetical protein [Paraflavitalea speifideaquila]|uniref:hypothetical protein n=1 Tax=Paraflavitalea speifideaquila TaxID=3076558 RepID=UPI0028EDA28E|nr:hypothetical protein [Paraflavitalea speifideiaquila]